MSEISLTLDDELIELLSPLLRRDRRLARELARQVVARADPGQLAAWLLTPELATSLLLRRLRTAPGQTRRQLERLQLELPRLRDREPGRRRRRRIAPSFVKWAGAKGPLADRIRPVLPPTFGTYYEPMVGGGSLFLALAPARAVLSDVNDELMSCYRVIRDQLAELVDALGWHVNSQEHFLRVRAQDPATLSPVARAARTIYLNKTCFHGLYRVNASGRFNVPYGHYPGAKIRDVPTLRKVHQRLQGVTLRSGDYADCLRDAGPGDLVYLDPPYLDHSTGRRPSFCAYQPRAFDEDEHRRLAAFFRQLDARGCHVVLSNSDAPLVRSLYRGYRIQTIPVVRQINHDASGDGRRREVLVHNGGPRRR